MAAGHPMREKLCARSENSATAGANRCCCRRGAGDKFNLPAIRGQHKRLGLVRKAVLTENRAMVLLTTMMRQLVRFLPTLIFAVIVATVAVDAHAEIVYVGISTPGLYELPTEIA